MEWVTTTAKTLPEAIDLALDNLGVDESEAEIVVLEEPSKGLFGRVRGTARVEARVKPKAIRPKTERGRNRRGRGDNKSRGDRSRRGRSNDRSARSSNNGKNSGGGGGRRGGGQSNRGAKDAQNDDRNTDVASNDAAEATTGVEAAAGTSRSRSGSESKSKSRDRSGNARGGSDSGSGDDGDSRGRGRGRRSKGSGSSGGSNEGKAGNGNRKAKNDKKPADNNNKETPVEEVAEHLRSFLGGLTEAFGLEGDVDIDTSETDVMVATVEGQHGLMVGPKGRTLDAIQELARVSSQRAAPSNIRIRIDVGGYRKQRAAALGDFARKAADTAVDSGAEVALEPMSPADRKSIHDALVEDDRVETRSVGTEPRRKVVVIPAEDAAGSGSDDSDSGEEE